MINASARIIIKINLIIRLVYKPFIFAYLSRVPNRQFCCVNTTFILLGLDSPTQSFGFMSNQLAPPS